MPRGGMVGPLAVLLLWSAAAFPQQVDPILFGALHWRLIGPFRAGRVSAGAVDPVDPNTYYLGTANGGVWKSINAGETWKPIFDQVGVASIGAIAVSPSNPAVIYVGTGEETRGDGVFKSTDGGATWTSVGLRETRLIGSILIDPGNPDVVLVAAIGDRTSGAERGVFRSTDGGRTWSKVLYRDETSGCPSIVAAPDAPQIIYATLYPGAGARGASPTGGRGGTAAATGGPTAPPGPSIHKSTDGGATWTPLAARGLPGPPSGRQAFGVVAGTSGRRVFAGARGGLFRSDDGGETWERWTDDPRIRPVGVITDPRNPDVLYVTQTSMYRSTDGGRTFESFAGAPSGDDFQLLWIDPRNPRRLLAGVDQGGIVSVDGGATWSSWYNQPTGQFYHVATDTRFPYRVYAAQQDSGSVAVPHRSDYGEISFRDWFSPGGFEFGYVVPSPIDPDIVFAGGWYRTIVRFDRRTGQIVHVFVPGTKYRSVSNAPMAFSPQDPKTLYLGTQFLMKTTDAGMTWQAVSPDLTDVPAKTATPVAATAPRGPQGAAITTFSPSTVKAGEIWAATGNGVVQLTEDGGATWRNVSPPDLPARGSFEIIDAGRHDAATAYAVLIVPQDLHPYIYRTHDKGATWQKIVEGLADTAIARVVRVDPVRPGLLYCGTETSVYVSFDDGDHWQSLQLNLPASSMRDMVVQGDDLVLATYGRALWILDNVTPLRQITADLARADARLFVPATPIRARWDVNGDTPLPIETPTAANPPDGAMIDYYLKSPPAGDLELTISDERGTLVRTYSSVPPPAPKLLANVPSYWFAPPAVLTKKPGMNRFVWNLRYPNPKVLPFAYSGGMLTYVEYTLADHAIPGETPRDQPEGALVPPGEYTVELAAGGRSYRQRLTVKPDPRIKASLADLGAEFELAKFITDALAATYDGYEQLAGLRAAIADRAKALGATAVAGNRSAAPAGAAPLPPANVSTPSEPGGVRLQPDLSALDAQVAAIQNGTPAAPGLGLVNRDMARYFNMVESGDARPAETLRAAVNGACEALTKALAGWRQLDAETLPSVNKQLAAQKLAALPAAATIPVAPRCGK